MIWVNNIYKKINKIILKLIFKVKSKKFKKINK